MIPPAADVCQPGETVPHTSLQPLLTFTISAWLDALWVSLCVMTDSQLHVHFWSSSRITDILQWSREIISWIMSALQTTKWRSGQEIDDLLYWFLTKWKLAGSRSGLCCLIKNKRKTTFYTWQMFPNVGAGKYSAVFSGMCSYRHITRCNCGKVFHPRYCTSMW